jgi:hypothetical protein
MLCVTCSEHSAAFDFWWMNGSCTVGHHVIHQHAEAAVHISSTAAKWLRLFNGGARREKPENETGVVPRKPFDMKNPDMGR